MNNRREFLKSAGRNSVLFLFGFSAIAGFALKKINTDAKAACPTNPSCKGCGQLTHCQKDQAKDYYEKSKTSVF